MSLAESSSDGALAARAAAGDDGAFTALVHRHKAALFRLLRRYCGNADEAEEAVQEAFIAAWMAIGRYDRRRPFGPWLRTIAINKSRDRGRRATVRRLIFGAGALEDSRAAESPDLAPLADESLIDRQRLNRLDGAIAELPASLKEPLLLTYFDGWSHREAGEIMGISTKSVETRVRRARQLLSRFVET